MNKEKVMNQVKSFRRKAFIGVILLAMICGTLITCDTGFAATGKVGGCSITCSYRHPVTGVIVDAGGEAGYATGQGMVESIGYKYGMIEETSDGQVYVTVRLTMQDMVSNVSFKSQVRGGSGWSSMGTTVTNQGSDSNGVTKDYAIKVQSRDAVIKCSMYVDPMGRAVEYFLSPSGFNPGSTNGFVATHVTEQEKNVQGKDTGKVVKKTQDNKAKADVASQEAIGLVEDKIQAIGQVTIEKENLINDARAAYDSLKPAEQKKVSNYDLLKAAEKELVNIKTRELERPDVEKTLNTAKGLTLSTEKAETEGNGNTAAIVLGIIVIVAAVGGGGYYAVQRKKKGSGDTRDDDQ